MNRNFTALILIVLAIGIYFTFTRYKLDELKEIRIVNSEYQQAIDNSERLTKVRDNVLAAYNSISDEDKDRLNKIVPDNVDNVRLIIDVKDDIAARHGLALKNIKTSSPDAQQQAIGTNDEAGVAGKYGIVTLSFGVTTSYQVFVDFLKDLESSLRIMDISKLTVAVSEAGGTYDFGVEVKTYWLKQ
ncbi:MAG: hypothetical protein Q8Q03_02995 [bacterium]|nr:hypothetical protein [bacterium]